MHGPEPTNEFALAIGPLEMPPRAAITRAAEHNIRCIQWSANHPGMRPRDLGGSARRDLSAALRRHGQVLTGIDLWIPAAHFENLETRDRAIEAPLAAIVLAEDLGRVTLSTSLPQQGDSAQSTRQLIAAEAERRGVTVADHDIDAHATPGSALGLGIDPAALIAGGRDPAAAIVKAGETCKSARISDLLTSGSRGPLGLPDGQLDVLAFRAALGSIEYDKPLVIDSRQWRDPWQGIDQTMAAWNSAMPRI